MASNQIIPQKIEIEVETSMEFVGKKVAHVSLGEGIISSVHDNYLSIAFKEGVKVFTYPDSFEKFLSTEDTELRADAQKLLAEKSASRRKIEEAAQKKQCFQMSREPVRPIKAA